MPLSQLETKRVEKALLVFLKEHRPPPHVRSKLDFGFRITGQSVELFEIRPQWDKPSVKREHPFAKATYVKTTGTWKVFWQRADLKWHGYEPAPQVGSIEQFLAIVGADEYSCFFG
jgi:Protein of unknown function (DUF3024)